MRRDMDSNDFDERFIKYVHQLNDVKTFFPCQVANILLHCILNEYYHIILHNRVKNTTFFFYVVKK